MFKLISAIEKKIINPVTVQQTQAFDSASFDKDQYEFQELIQFYLGDKSTFTDSQDFGKLRVLKSVSRSGSYMYQVQLKIDNYTETATHFIDKQTGDYNNLIFSYTEDSVPRSETLPKFIRKLETYIKKAKLPTLKDAKAKEFKDAWEQFQI